MPLPEAWQFEAIGTRWLVTSETPLDQTCKQAVRDEIELFDHAYSRFRDDSIVSQLSRDGGTHTFDHSLEFAKLYGLYHELYEATGGAVTPLVGDVLEAAGYDAQYSLKPQRVAPQIMPLDEVVQWGGADTVTLAHPALLDVGAAGKGLLADIVARTIDDYGITEFVVDASGDIAHHAEIIYTVGLEDPADPTRVIGTIQLQYEALCSSATNRRAWGDMHHVIDGRDGTPTRDIIATWVLCADAMTADGLATALFFMDNPESLMAKHSAAWLRIDQAGTITMNELMQKRVTLFI